MSERIIIATLVLLFHPLICRAIDLTVSNDSYGEWKPDSEKSGVKIYSRLRPGSPVKEFKATGEIAAPSRAVCAVIDDLEAYPSFMPYTKECRLLKREENSFLTYQRLSPPLVSNRDYTLRIRKKTQPGSGGLICLSRWEPANELGPPEKPGVVRVKVCEGGWLLEPKGANSTLASYCIYTDTGGAISAFIANKAGQVSIVRLFEAVRKQVKDPKYSARP